MSQAIEDRYEQVRHLLALGKERGYLLFDEVNDILPAEVHSPEEIDDLLATFERYGIEIYEDVAVAKAARASQDSPDIHEEEAPESVITSDDLELDLAPGVVEKNNDPVRIYLREMGSVPLLTREGEVALAKRIERGQLLVLKTITRSPIILQELVETAKDLREGSRTIKEIVHFDEEELTETKIENKTRQTLKSLDKIAALYEVTLKRTAALEERSEIAEASLSTGQV